MRRLIDPAGFRPNPAKRRKAKRAVAGESPDDARAVELRETFTDRPMERIEALPWSWPKSLLHVGRCEAVMYESDKWKARRGEMESYKHVAEGPQDLYVREGFIVGYDDDVRVVGALAELEHMPESFAVLADAVGFQCTLFAEDDEGLYLPNRGNALQVDMPPGCKLGGGEHTVTGKRFLVFYHPTHGVLALVTGEILDIEADGITG